MPVAPFKLLVPSHLPSTSPPFLSNRRISSPALHNPSPTAASNHEERARPWVLPASERILAEHSQKLQSQHGASKRRHVQNLDPDAVASYLRPKNSQLNLRRIIMKLFSANIEDLRSLYIDNLQKALDMEQNITKALPRMIEHSSDAALANAFRNHLEETRGHVSKVQRLLDKATG